MSEDKAKSERCKRCGVLRGRSKFNEEGHCYRCQLVLAKARRERDARK